MKKLIVTIVILMAALVYANTIVVPFDKAGERVDPGAVQSARPRWEVIDTTSSTGTEPSDLTVTGRTYQLVKTAIAAAQNGDDEISIFDIPRSWNTMRLRCIGITDDTTVTYQIYAGTLGDGNRDTDSTTADCELAYIGQYAFTIGTQASITSGYEMADLLTVTPSDWTKAATSSTPGGNRVAESRIDLMGADLIVAVPTTAGSDCKLLGRGF